SKKSSRTPSMNQALASRSRNNRYVAPSLTVTSHSSRSHGLSDLPDSPDPPGPPDPVSASHHSPDVRHGPAHFSIRPPLIPRRSVVTRTGRPSSTSTRAGTANRNRRRATTSAFPSPPSPPSPPPSPGAKGHMSNAPGLQEPTRPGAPQRPSPIKALSRAISVDTCSGDGSGRVSSEYGRTRAGVGSTATTT